MSEETTLIIKETPLVDGNVELTLELKFSSDHDDCMSFQFGKLAYEWLHEAMAEYNDYCENHPEEGGETLQ